MEEKHRFFEYKMEPFLGNEIPIDLLFLRGEGNGFTLYYPPRLLLFLLYNNT